MRTHNKIPEKPKIILFPIFIESPLFGNSGLVVYYFLIADPLGQHSNMRKATHSCLRSCRRVLWTHSLFFLSSETCHFRQISMFPELPIDD